MGYVTEMNELIDKEVKEAMERIGAESLGLLAITLEDDRPDKHPRPDVESYIGFFEDIYDIANEYLDAIRLLKEAISTM